MASLAKMLKEVDKAWESAEAAEGGFTKIPEGDYVGVLQPIRVELSKASDRLQIAWPLKITQGKLKGKVHIKFDGLESEMNMSYVKAIMNTLGIPIPDKATDLPEIFETWQKKKYKDREIAFTVKEAGEFTNTYINKYAEEGDGDGDDDSADDKGKGKDKDKGKNDLDLTKKEIRKMDKKTIKALIKKEDIDIDPTDYEGIDELQDALISELGL